MREECVRPPRFPVSNRRLIWFFLVVYVQLLERAPAYANARPKTAMDSKQKNRLIFSTVNFAVLMVAIYLATRLIPGAQSKAVSYSDFLVELRADHLSEVQVTEHELIGVLKSDAAHAKNPGPPQTITATRLPGVDESELLKELEAHPVKFQGRIDQTSWIWNILGWVLPFLFIVLIFRMGMRRMTQAGGALTFGKNRAKIHDESSTSKVTFDDVAGLDEAKLELEEVVDFLRQPAKYQNSSAAGFRKAFCWWDRRAPARPCWRKPWPAKRACPSSRSQDRSLWRCSSASVRPACATCLSRPS